MKKLFDTSKTRESFSIIKHENIFFVNFNEDKITRHLRSMLIFSIFHLDVYPGANHKIYILRATINHAIIIFHYFSYTNIQDDTNFKNNRQHVLSLSL